MSTTTIHVSTELRDRLFYRKHPGESYEDVLRRELPREVVELATPDAAVPE